MKKKFLALITVFFYTFSLFGLTVHAEDTSASDSIIEYFGEEKGTQLIHKVDGVVEKISQSKTGFYSIKKSLEERSIALQKKQNLTKQEEGIKRVLLYITSELNKKNIDILPTSPKELTGSDFTQQERTTIENKIISLQNDFLTNIERSQNKNAAEAEMKGKFNAEVRANQEFLGSFLTKVQVEDIFGKIKGADSDISGKLNLEVTNSGTTSSLKTDVQLISKDGDQYIKVAPLEKTGTGNDMFETLQTGLNVLAEQGTFVKTQSNSGEDIQKIVENIQSLFPLYLSKIKSESLLTPYKKVGGAALLVPSNLLCSVMKNAESTTWEDCSENEYSFMLQEYKDTGLSILLETKDQTDTFTISGSNDSAQVFGKITLQDNQIQTIKIDIIPNQSIYPKEGFSLSYENKRLDIKFRVSDINFGARIEGDSKQFSGKYALSFPGGGLIQGTIKGTGDDKNANIDITLDSKNITGEGENINGKIHMEVTNATHVIFGIEGSYKQSDKEVFGGNVLYDITVEPKSVDITAPKDWIDINDINSSGE